MDPTTPSDSVVVKTKAPQKLFPIEKHRYLKRSSIGDVIYYVRGGLKFSCHTTKIGDALRYVEERLLIKSGLSEATAKRTMTGERAPLLDVLWLEFLKFKSADVGPSTISKYTTNWNCIREFWRGKTSNDIHKEELQNFKGWYLKNHSTRYSTHTMVQFASFVRWMNEQGYVKTMPDLKPLSKVESVVNKNARREKVGRRYTRIEVENLLSTSKSGAAYIKLQGSHLPSQKKRLLSHRAYLAILLAVRNGCRKMEILKLRWEDVDLDANLLKIWSQKNHKWRTIPFTDEVREAFRDQVPFARGSQWVFPMETDPARHMSSQIFDKCWVRVKRVSGLTGRARFHDLRHTCASEIADAGWPIIAACQYLDMSVKIFQKVYAKPSLALLGDLVFSTFSLKVAKEVSRPEEIESSKVLNLLGK